MRDVTELEYVILLCLGILGVSHPYKWMLESEELTGVSIALSRAGSVYRSTAKLNKNGLIKKAKRPRGETDFRRGFYSVTTKGRKMAEIHAQKLAKMHAASERAGFLG